MAAWKSSIVFIIDQDPPTATVSRDVVGMERSGGQYRDARMARPYRYGAL